MAGGNATVGTIDLRGLYVGPAVPPDPNTVTVEVTSAVDSTRADSALVSVVHPQPSLSSISPSTAVIGGAVLSLTVEGSNFVSGAVAGWDGADRATTVESNSRVVMEILPEDIAAPGTAQITVFNPGPGGGTSNSLAFRILEGWQEDFGSGSLDEARWIILDEQSPRYIPDKHIGYYEAGHVRLEDGYLSMLLTQERGIVDSNENGVISRGALIFTNETYGYGTYEWRMRTSSTAASPNESGACGPRDISGSVSAGFIYVNNSETEIDFEVAGHRPDLLYMVNWNNTDPATDPESSESMASTIVDSAILPLDESWCSNFRTYRFVWEEGLISFYVDDVWQAEHTVNVPTAPAHLMISHWGTSKRDWGGKATIGTARYFYVDWVRYTPLQ
jgi:endo-1,3-1,4-beta-glycanase ExoK